MMILPKQSNKIAGKKKNSPCHVCNCIRKYGPRKEITYIKKIPFFICSKIC